MVFWKTYPIKNIIKSKYNNDIFKDLQFEKDDIYDVKILDRDIESIRDIKNFIKINFGGHNKPVLDIPEDKIYDNKDIILYVKDIEIVGCIRYHYIGLFLDKNMYCVDCFCIHPLCRKKGIGDILLTKLHIYVNKNKIPYSMFLKEGHPLNIIVTPLCSGTYIYRKIDDSNVSNIIKLTIDKAYKLLDIYNEFNPIFIIKNKENTNQHWRIYINGSCKVLACIQDTYQYLNGKKMGWITAWLESPITDEERKEALKQISNSMYTIFYYIWGNKNISN